MLRSRNDHLALDPFGVAVSGAGILGSLAKVVRTYANHKPLNEYWRTPRMLRDKAALALVGWYLIAPPMTDKGPNFDAPFSQWEIHHVFDSARECDTTRYRWRERAQKAEEKGSEENKMTLGKWYVLVNAFCIATDDPRLKEQ